MHGHISYTQKDAHFCKAEQKNLKQSAQILSQFLWKLQIYRYPYYLKATFSRAVRSSTAADKKKHVPLPVNGFDMHLQAVSTRGSMATLLTHERLFASMFGGFMHTQLCPG